MADESLPEIQHHVEQLLDRLRSVQEIPAAGAVLPEAWPQLQDYLHSNQHSLELVGALNFFSNQLDRSTIDGTWLAESSGLPNGGFWWNLFCGILSFSTGKPGDSTGYFHSAGKQAKGQAQRRLLLAALQRNRQWEAIFPLAESSLTGWHDDPVQLSIVARAASRLEDHTLALEILDQACARFPAEVSLLCQLGHANLAAQDAASAIGHFVSATRLNPDCQEATLGQFIALRKLDRHEESASLLKRCGTEVQDASTLRTALDYLTRLDDAEGISLLLDFWQSGNAAVVSHLKAVHDAVRNRDSVFPARSRRQTAADFDHLAGTLEAGWHESGFQGHRIVDQFLTAALDPPRQDLEVLDLGCGTGKCSSALRNYARTIIGVDISPGMLQQALQKGIHDELVVADMLDFLSTTDQQFDLVFAYDTLIHMGDLNQALSGISRVLKPGGLLVFNLTCPAAEDGAPFSLLRDGQYCHSVAYTLGAIQAAGLSAVRLERRAPAWRYNLPAYQFLALARKGTRKGTPTVEQGNSEPPAVDIRDRAGADEVELFNVLVERKPNLATAHFGLGNALLSQGQYREAIRAFETSSEMRPRAECFNNCGNAHAQLGDLAGAYRQFQAAIACDASFLPSLNNAGRAALALGDVEQAKHYLERALELDPDNAKALAVVGRMRFAEDDLAGATEALSKSLAADPRQPEVHLLLGQIQHRTGNLDGAIQQLVLAQQLNPYDASTYHSLGEVNRDRGQISEAGFCFLRALQLDPDNLTIHSNLLHTMLFESSIGSGKLLEEAERWNAKDPADGGQCYRFEDRKTAGDRPLRVGLVAAGRSPAAICDDLDLLEMLRSAGFECHHYSGQRSLSDHHPPGTGASFVRDLSDRELANLVHTDQIDILIDRDGHAPGNRLGAFAMKPAPLQITWSEIPGTTGLAAMDYILADHQTVPDHQRCRYSERPLWVAGCYRTFREPKTSAEVSAQPALARGGITFGCFSSANRLSPETISAWARILNLVPQSRLFVRNWALSNSSVASRIRQVFREHGIHDDRVQLDCADAGEIDWEHFLPIDIALDTFPCADIGNAFRFLWMGIPVISRVGDRFAANTTASLLHHLDLPRFCAENAEDYVELARTIAAEVDELARLRSQLRNRIRTASIVDPQAMSRQLEQRLREVWTDGHPVANPDD